MESAYLLSFLVYLLVYLRLFRKNDVYLCDIKFKYKFALLIQGSIFQMFYHFVFTFFNENHAMYDLDAGILRELANQKKTEEVKKYFDEIDEAAVVCYIIGQGI